MNSRQDKPRIGVTVSRRTGWRIFPLMALNIWLAGGRAVKWQAEDDVDLSKVDGVLIGGGDDIAPTLYKGTLTVEARLDPERDAMEKRILEDALEEKCPVMGICRGAQMLNVVLGGTLHQDAYAEYPSRRYKTILPRREVHIDSGSRLARITGTSPMRVNALHRQSVRALGRGLRVSARDSGGMVQAIERTRDPFALGVQWHPEHIFYAHRHRALFSALVAAAEGCRSGQGQIATVERRVNRMVW
ncbi:gamma-glutamyl-gamma-aminobutyrate hydrolase family protein [Roseibacterium beibuensis]|uniref:Glutamine amidotransferase n=1 Tax=[Roseibacterium] beibuensis TaxID=1193142 RepID=A0ABP9LQ50_9RHOB|nr:gamma-glutamyl-gamma-aminobutyrate hydrolase family protein [Roseibacterium beibuensis]MCS6626889.1 gamma-glutamyl-gamma-aminobutyrate hydrolase family protein [Roseibacterium beibuensis]